MEWLRLYTNIINDPKVMQMPELYRWRYVALLCLFRINNDSLPVEDDIVFSLRLSKKEWEKTENEFKKKGFLVNNTINGWETRQYKSDASKERVKKYRERLKQSYGNGYGNSYNREGILKRDNYSCVYCGSTENICIDHIIPLVSGGSNAPDNLAVACKSCNSGKSGRTPEEAGFSFCNKDAENRYKNNVTVTVTVQEQNRTETETETERKRETPPNLIKLSKNFHSYQNEQYPKLLKKVSERIVNNGAIELEKLIRIDKYTTEDIEKVLTFVKKDAFWSRNILSLCGIRKKGNNGNTKFVNAMAQMPEKKEVHYGIE